MSTSKLADANKLLDRVMEAYNLDTDAELARFLKRSTSTIATWRKRNNFKIGEILEFVSDLNMNWWFFDEKPKWRKDIDSDPLGYLFAEDPGNNYGGYKPIPDGEVGPDNFVAEVIARLEGAALPRDMKIEIVNGLIERLEKRIQQIDSDPDSDSQKTSDS